MLILLICEKGREGDRKKEREKKREKTEERKGDCVLVDLSHFQCKFSSDGTNE
jgi:hypothetical protein